MQVCVIGEVAQPAGSSTVHGRGNAHVFTCAPHTPPLSGRSRWTAITVLAADFTVLMPDALQTRLCNVLAHFAAFHDKYLSSMDPFVTLRVGGQRRPAWRLEGAACWSFGRWLLGCLPASVGAGGGAAAGSRALSKHVQLPTQHLSC